MRLKFKNADDARRAVAEYNGKSADGKILTVTIKGTASTSLSGRLGGGVVSESVDVLMDDEAESAAGS